INSPGSVMLSTPFALLDPKKGRFKDDTCSLLLPSESPFPLLSLPVIPSLSYKMSKRTCSYLSCKQAVLLPFLHQLLPFPLLTYHSGLLSFPGDHPTHRLPCHRHPLPR